MRSFEELLKEHYSSLETYVRYKVSSREDAEDILQEACVKAFNGFSSLAGEGSFRAWLISIGRNLINDHYRKKARVSEVPYDEAIQYITVNRSVADIVRETLDLLDDDERELLDMYYFQEMSVREIAEKLGIPEGTVKSRISSARNSFKNRYPKEEVRIMKLPDKIFDYEIVKTDKEPFETKWEELMGWFLIPKEGNKISFGIYDFPERTLTEQIDMKCNGKAEIHGITGVKIDVVEKQGRKRTERKFVAQLTDTHCRYLAETNVVDGVEKLYTFMDGEAFLNNWGFGPENIGNETDLKMKGLIKREGSVVEFDDSKRVMDVVGRYDVTINGRTYDTVCLMDMGCYDENCYTEQYIDRTGRTVLWRRFNKANWRWNYSHFEEILDEKLRDNEKITVNGVECYHWYDCITGYIL